jgi:hypothetical protein
MAEPQTKRWTVADLEALPYDEMNRYEIIDGELFVSRQPRDEHQDVSGEIHLALGNWNHQTRLGSVLATPGSSSASLMPWHRTSYGSAAPAAPPSSRTTAICTARPS